MISQQTRKRRIRLLERRLAHLDERIDKREAGYTGDSYDIAEAFALEWALGIIRNAIDKGQVANLEDAESGGRDERDGQD